MTIDTLGMRTPAKHLPNLLDGTGVLSDTEQGFRLWMLKDDELRGKSEKLEDTEITYQRRKPWPIPSTDYAFDGFDFASDSLQ